MEYSRIVAVSGMPGLYEVLSTKSDGAIVRSLQDESTKFVSSRVYNLTHLESIEIYTTADNVPLTDVFTAIQESSEALPDVKDSKALKQFFEKVYPQIDFERVYASDMKKLINWYNVVKEKNIDFSIKEAEENADDNEANAGKSLEAAGEKAVADVTSEPAPEVAKPKAKRKKKED